MSKKIFILLTSILLLTGCVGKLKSYNPLDEDEVIDYVKNTIYKDLGEEVEVEIQSKYQEYLCDANIDNSCFGKHKVPKTFTYHLTITSKNNSEISSKDCYFTDSYKENDMIIERRFDYQNYKKVYSQTRVINEIKEILQDYKYEIKEDQIFIFSKDYDYLHRQLFTHLLNIDYGYYEKWPIINYDIYVIKDEDLFNDLITSTFDYRGVAGKANNIKNAYGYAREFMEIEKSDDYKYVFFRYSSNGCSGCMNGCSCSIVYGMN